ncbi:hypothetical protein [uncultured Enterococcus sp.]|uniref:hypothetical protein n=1 Tax=uncultured Enterococcus sp. TaxID=167972 RepID=UPI002583DC2A|nr:hypothetical protein [uncultured Enterococcus sp.]
MDQHTTNYKTLNQLSYIRFGHKIGHGWYAILITAEKELSNLGYSIRNVRRMDGALIISTQRGSKELPSEVQHILYKAELASEMTCEWCGNYSVSQTVVDNETYTICEECQENCESLAGIEKRLRLYKTRELEQDICILRNELKMQKVRSVHYKVGRDQYRTRSEKLSKQLGEIGKKPSVFKNDTK